MKTIKKAQSGATTKKKTVPMSVAKKKVDSLRYDAYTRREAGKNRTIGSKGYDSIAKELMETAKKSDSLANVWEKNIKKAKSKPKLQKGGKVVKKKTTPHPNDDYKNMKDPATGKKGTMGGEGTQPPFPIKSKKKLQVGGKIKGNPQGYNPKTSPLPNTENKGNYEKKLDTIGKGSLRSVRMIDGKGRILGQERLGTTAAEKLASKFKKEKSYTDKRRNLNKNFLDDKKAIAEAASKASTKKTMKSGGKISNTTIMKKSKMKSGGKFPDLNKDGKITKADILKGRGVIAKKGAVAKKTMKAGGKMTKCKYGCK